MLLFLEYEGELIADVDFEPSEELLSEEISELAERLEIQPLESFLSADEEEYDDIETQWFSAAEGLNTAEALINEINNSEAELSDEVLDDLKSLQSALKILEKSGRKFYLTME